MILCGYFLPWYYEKMKLRIKKKSLLLVLLGVTIINVLVLVLMLFNPFAPKEIIMDENGFTPDTLIVSQYTPIIFINKDSSDRWPASNVHPTHEKYPEFDSQQGVKPDETWSFTPKNVGKWQFHDHLFPHRKGLIIVKKASMLQIFLSKYFIQEKKEEKITIQNDLNKSSQESIAKTYNSLKEYAKTNGTEKLWAHVLTTYGKEDGSQGNIHDIAHFAGKLIFDEKGLEGISICTPVFAFGCYHGLLDSAFTKNLDRLADAEKACAGIDGVNSGSYHSCVHGIGHGVASFYKSKDLAASLRSCERLVEDAQNSCFDGIFMEFGREASGNYYKKDEPLFPCNTLNIKYQYSCGRNIPSIMMTHFNLSFKEIATACNSSTASIKNSCFTALGFLATYKGEGNVAKIKAFCTTLSSEEFISVCTTSAAGEVIFQQMTNWPTLSQDICQTLPEKNLQNCLNFTDTIKKSYNFL